MSMRMDEENSEMCASVAVGRSIFYVWSALFHVSFALSLARCSRDRIGSRCALGVSADTIYLFVSTAPLLMLLLLLAGWLLLVLMCTFFSSLFFFIYFFSPVARLNQTLFSFNVVVALFSLCLLWLRLHSCVYYNVYYGIPQPSNSYSPHNFTLAISITQFTFSPTISLSFTVCVCVRFCLFVDRNLMNAHDSHQPTYIWPIDFRIKKKQIVLCFTVSIHFMRPLCIHRQMKYSANHRWNRCAALANALFLFLTFVFAYTHSYSYTVSMLYTVDTVCWVSIRRRHDT